MAFVYHGRKKNPKTTAGPFPVGNLGEKTNYVRNNTSAAANIRIEFKDNAEYKGLLQPGEISVHDDIILNINGGPTSVEYGQIV